MKEVLPYLIGGGGFITGVVLAIIAWIRFKKKDEASVIKITAEANKTDAESHEIRARADVLITDGALRIVDRLSKDLDEARDEIERLIGLIAESQKLYEKTKIEFALETQALHEKLREAKELMATKRRHCIETKDRITQLRDLLLLKQQGLTYEQLNDFVKKLNELITPNPV